MTRTLLQQYGLKGSTGLQIPSGSGIPSVAQSWQNVDVLLVDHFLLVGLKLRDRLQAIDLAMHAYYHSSP